MNWKCASTLRIKKIRVVLEVSLCSRKTEDQVDWSEFAGEFQEGADSNTWLHWIRTQKSEPQKEEVTELSW